MTNKQVKKETIFVSFAEARSSINSNCWLMLFKARKESHEFNTILKVLFQWFRNKSVLDIFLGYLNMEKIYTNIISGKKRNKSISFDEKMISIKEATVVQNQKFKIIIFAYSYFASLTQFDIKCHNYQTHC